MKWTGGCLCGAVQFEVTERPYMDAYCYCKMYQRWSGSVLTSWACFKATDFSCTKGEIKFHKSSQFTERGFCPECGSSLVQHVFEGDLYSVASGCFDHSEEFPPREHGGIEAKVSWLVVDDDLPRKSTKEHMSFSVDD